MDSMTELEEMVSEQEPEPTPSPAPMRNSAIAYHLGVFLIDLVTGYTVGVLTFWYYGVIWFLGNAVVFFQHHRNWERAENNDTQEKNSQVGMIVAVSSMFIVALAAGGFLLAGMRNVWVQIGFEALSVTLFFFHILQFALYRFSDDAWKLNRAIAKANAIANKKVAIAKAGGRVVEANKRALQERNHQYKKHGDPGAVNAAMASMQGKERAYAQTAPKVELDDPNSPAGKDKQP